MKIKKYVFILSAILHIPLVAVAELDSTIVACAHKHTGNLRVVDVVEDCNPSEVSIEWNKVGPAGPEGPEGQDGPSGIGNRSFVVSTASAVGVTGQPPTQIPGLETVIGVSNESALLVQADLKDFSSCIEFVCCTGGNLVLEVDNQRVATRRLTGFSSGNSGALEDYGITWMSGNLIGSNHEVRLLVEAVDDGDSHDIDTTTCVGSGGGESDRYQGRMSVIELKQ